MDMGVPINRSKGIWFENTLTLVFPNVIEWTVSRFDVGRLVGKRLLKRS